MGLFDKKFCDVCGEKIGLLGNRKLEDGNLCKDCARKLSPFFSERRSSTVEEIKAQLEYREQNKTQVANFRPTKEYGYGSKKVYVDMNQRKFIVTSDSTWQDSNPDVIDFSQVTSVNTDIEEHKSEIYYENSEGKEVSYNPRRYEFEYEFEVKIFVDSPWFNDITLELSSYSQRPDTRYSQQYRDLENMQAELVAVLTGQQMPNSFNQPVGIYGQPQNMGYQQGGFSQPQYGNQPMYNTPQGGYNQPQNGPYGAGYVQSAPMGAQPQQNFSQPSASAVWFCQNCGTENSGKFCQGCGSPRPVNRGPQVVRCDKCGWMSQPGTQPPRFCPQCGDPVDFRDM
ncbi:MAG: DUF4428 domain-containing protein [Ruminococcaceae bacterium]|nr:DUF4428 domain-containing protein [Oscillospiraceae bacterium]